MPFILISCTQVGRRAARVLSDAITSKGIGYCASLDALEAEVRWTAWRLAIERCDLLAAIVTEADLADEAFVDNMAFAHARGKLIIIGLNALRAPATLGGASETFNHWNGHSRNEDLERACEAIEAALAPSPDQERFAPAMAASEVEAFLRLHKKATPNKLAKFLSDHPGGIFDDVVRAQLDASTRPAYHPVVQPEDGAPNDAAGASDREDDASALWRMDEPAKGRAVGWRLAGGGAVLAVATAGMIFASDWDTRSRNSQSAAMPDAPILQPSSSVSTAAAQPVEAPPETSEVASLASAAEVEPVVLTEAVPSGSSALAYNTIAPPSAALSAIVTPVQTDALRQNRLTRFTVPAQLAVRYDANYRLDEIDRNTRDAAMRARRARLSGLQSAERDEASEPVHRGDWQGVGGQGVAVWQGGRAYAGDWSGSAPNGYGVLLLDDGSRYEGEFVSGRPTGRGILWDSDGSRIVGERLFEVLLTSGTPSSRS